VTNAEAVEWLYAHRRLRPDTLCWEYTGDTTQDGKYGRVSAASVIGKWSGETLVHRISAKVFSGFEGGGLANKLTQICENTLCFNYDHLRRLSADTLKCSRCGAEHRVSDRKFYGPYPGKHVATDGYHPWCKACWKRYYAQNRKQMIATTQRWKDQNPEAVSLYRRQRTARKKAGRVGNIRYKRILARDDWTCHICGDRVLSLDDLHFDHVIPLSRGGEHSEDNIAVSHAKCNLRKYTSVVPSRLQQLHLGIEPTAPTVTE
jgi:hypothetical protein